MFSRNNVVRFLPVFQRYILYSFDAYSSVVFGLQSYGIIFDIMDQVNDILYKFCKVSLFCK